MSAEHISDLLSKTLAKKRLEKLFAEQGKKPIKSWEELADPDIWPEDDIEEFLAWLDRIRSGKE